MYRILCLGAGKSTEYLISYLAKMAQKRALEITVADLDEEALNTINQTYSSIHTIWLDASKAEERLQYIKSADLVISFLPPSWHFPIASDCLRSKTHLITPSYRGEDMQALQDDFKKEGLICITETGLDPGIDHASACRTIEHLMERGHTITGFESYTGGLIAPESVDNPWNYKITWNPDGVLYAGRRVNRYLFNGNTRIIPWQRLFKRAFPVEVPEVGTFEAYPNRDSLPYADIYGLDQANTLLRGTLRPTGFCQAWDHLVHLGLIENEPKVNHHGNLTWSDLTEMLLPTENKPIKQKLSEYLNLPTTTDTFAHLAWLGLFEHLPLPLKNAPPALQLGELLKEKWAMMEDDRDMIVMMHRFEYQSGNQKKIRTSTLTRKGTDRQKTAMAETVGLPVGICARLIMEQSFTTPGIWLPTQKAIYAPLLKELEDYGIVFKEEG